MAKEFSVKLLRGEEAEEKRAEEGRSVRAPAGRRTGADAGDGRPGARPGPGGRGRLRAGRKLQKNRCGARRQTRPRQDPEGPS